MRVVFVTWRDLANPLSGGSEVVIDRLIVELQDRGHEVALVAGGPVGARPYPVVQAGGTFSQYLVAPALCRRRFSGWDVLVDVENGVPYFSPLWWRGPRVCLVHHVHTHQWPMRFGPLVAAAGRWAEGVVMPLVYRHELFVAISRSTADSLVELGIDSERIRTVESGIDLPAASAVREKVESADPLFVAVGRLVPHKRVDLILRAWETVRPVTGGRLVVVGDGPERQSLEEQAGASVEFTGRVEASERDRLLADAWLLVHAAHHEGWGMVIAEAAAWGTPALALDALGVRDVVADGVSGLLASSVEDLASQWIALSSDHERRKTLGKQARQRAEGMSWSATAEAFLGVLAEVAG